MNRKPSIVSLVRKAGYIYKRLPRIIRDDLKSEHKRAKILNLDVDEEVEMINRALDNLDRAQEARIDTMPPPA